MSEIKHTLKPCPFCGGTRQWVMGPTCDRNTPYNQGDRAFPIVRCIGCITDVSGRDFDAGCQSAVDNWNRRVDDAVLTERVRRLEEALKRLSALTPRRANAASANDLHLTVKAIADTALDTEKLMFSNIHEETSAALSAGGGNG